MLTAIVLCGMMKLKEGITMANVFNVARYILNKHGAMSTWKLQKLCYYSQAWSLAWTGAPIFDEDFEAWSNGPVCPALFQVHKGLFIVELKDIPIACENQPDLDSDQKETIGRILEEYGFMEPYELREQTHSEEPWKYARQGLPDGARCKNVISKDSIGEYYGSL